MSIEQFIKLNSNFLTFAPHNFLKDAISSLAGENFPNEEVKNNRSSCVLVVANNPKKIVGIVTKGDVLRAIASGLNPKSTTLDAVMTQPVISISRDRCHDLPEILSLMKQNFIGHLPVVSKSGQLIGIIDRETITHSVTRDSNKQKLAELAIQQQDFSPAIANTVGALVTVLDKQGGIVSFNHTCEEVTGYSFEEVQNKIFWDFLLLPPEKDGVKAVFEQLLVRQVPNQYENYWVAVDGSCHLISWSNTVLFDSKGEVEFIIVTGIDVTEQHQVWNKLEHKYRQIQLLAEIVRKIRMSIELDDILQTAVTEVQHLLGCDRVLIIEIRPNKTALPISESILPNLPSMLGYEITDPLLVGSYLANYCRGETLALENINTANISSDIKQLLQQFQVQAKLVVPILSQCKLQGLIVAHQCHNTRRWQKSEIELLNQLADQIGVALSQSQLLNHLEELVSQRTDELTTINQLLQVEISERQQTEIALRENQQKLRGILDNADEAIISIDERQHIQLFNKGAENIFGYNTQEIIGQPLDILLPAAFRQTHRQHINQFSTSLNSSRSMGERNSYVFGRRKNGTEFPAEASISRLNTREGMLFTVMLRDITERQQTQAQLQISQALLAKAEKIAKIGSWEYDCQTQQKSWSEELFHILGFDFSPILPSCTEILERVHPEDLLLVKNTLRRGHHQGESWLFHYRWIAQDGTVKYLESRGEPTVNDRGETIKVLETIMDVSDRIQAEKSRQRSEEQLRIITDALPILIAYIDSQQHYRYNNRTYEAWYGKSPSSLLGKSIQELVGNSNYQKMLPHIEAALGGEFVTFESQFMKENGHLSWISATYIPDLDSEGKVKGFFSMVDDITDRKVIEQIKSEFISVASHEMRTPLTSIHGVIKLLCAGRLGALTPSGKQMADMALRNSDRLVRLINDILDLERMESGRDSIERQSCHSGELIHQAVDTLKPIADEKNIILEVNSPQLKFCADRDRIIQTLTNLIGNAIKFSPAGSKVSISSQDRDQKMVFAIRDRGRGIPQDKLKTIFERFQQVDASDSRKKGGTGLGLAICRHIVEQHSGEIWVESDYGQGSTFYFSIPY